MEITTTGTFTLGDYCQCRRCPCCGKLLAPVAATPVWPVYPTPMPWWGETWCSDKITVNTNTTSSSAVD